ncbi:MAG: hypothetical protein AAGE01_15955 [Pseudomonadota bacterium]
MKIPLLLLVTLLPCTLSAADDDANQGFIYGRVTTTDGAVHEGQLRWGGAEEAFWSEYFNGARRGNRWADHVPDDQLVRTRPVRFLGLEIGEREEPLDLERPFMVRFGDIDRIDAQGRELRVTLKSGSVVDLDRFGADDFADGLEVRQVDGEVIAFDEWHVASVAFLPATPLGPMPRRLRGTVRSADGDFTGAIQWNRELGMASDAIAGKTDGGEVSLRFDAIQSITRVAGDAVRVALRNGREVVLAGTRDVGDGHRGVYVNDPRYGRVLISWSAFERVIFSDDGTGPGYDAFGPGRALTGTVTDLDGQRLAGRLVFDLDESESVETLDAPRGGINYTIPFHRIASIVPADGGRFAVVTLVDGEQVELEPAGDLGAGNAGLLVFVESDGKPNYVPWAAVRRVELDPGPTQVPRSR